jgi:NAD(P)-dependent dehydrogenase (short-subunit alcohol dehydrogenase family)
MGRLRDKTALITGGTSGIGLATAQRMAAEGAHVFITGRNKRTLDDAVASIGAAATGIRSDVTSATDLDTIVDAITAYGHGLDIVFTNAGGGEIATLADTTAEHFLATFNRNVGGTIFTVQKVLPILNAGASIILSGSTNAHEGIPAMGAYSASKAAVRSFGRTWAAELVHKQVRVNTIVPGPVETPGLTGAAPAGHQQEFLAGMVARVPMGRVGRPEEIAAAVVFLASDESSYMTGAELPVDGGVVQI